MNCKQLKKRIKDYKVLALLILVGLMTVTWLGWENRPAQMRSARYTNAKL
ncbi:hypothetical protein [Erysipelothrix piscisicarius]